jgi:cell division septation protein DedD
MKKVLAAAMLGAGLLAVPAGADVKAGVDAWGRGEYQKAIGEWRAPAAAGDADAQFNLGQAYKLGRGVSVDQAQATEWFRKAALQGHPQASDNYALALFQDGKKAEALPWLEKSAARDEKRTQLVLGTMLFNGDGVPRDWTRAYALVTRSSQQGLAQGSSTLAQMDRYIPEAQRRQGIELAQQIADRARQPGAVAPPRPGMASADLPPSSAPGATYAQPGTRPAPPAPRKDALPPRGTPGTSYASPRPAPSSAASTPPRPAPAPRPAAASGGAWRVQLGAFGNPDNARALWSRVGARVGGTPAYVKAGTVTRLQATGFASKAEAQRACAKAGTACVVVAP